MSKNDVIRKKKTKNKINEFNFVFICKTVDTWSNRAGSSKFLEKHNIYHFLLNFTREKFGSKSEKHK